MSLEGKYDPNNIFAKILRGDMPSVKLMEDEHIIAIMDAFPQSKGHCLVIPKAVSRNLLDTDSDVLVHVIAATQKLASAVKSALSPDGIRIAQFNGAPAGQTVFHLHFHVIPTYQGERLGAHGGGMADMDELKALADKIKAEL